MIEETETRTVDRGPELRRRVRAQLPPEAFRADPKKLLWIALHIGFILGCGALFRGLPSSWGLLFAILVGHSISCIAFLGHDLSHNSVVRGKRLRFVVERITWAFVLMPATIWIRDHNHMHHRAANTMDDSFRYFSESEQSVWRKIYCMLFFPNKRLPWSPLPFLSALAYNNLVMRSAMVPGSRAGHLLPNVPTYTKRERMSIAFEMASGTAVQVGLFYLVGGWSHYLWTGPCAFLVASFCGAAYVYTQHSMRPLSNVHDPVRNSTSVIVPRIFDKLHANHSYHTEHHLFDSMNSDYYPMVSEILEKEFGDDYHRLPFREVWHSILKNDVFKAEPSPAGAVAEKGPIPALK